jgi:hypothetical protein
MEAEESRDRHDDDNESDEIDDAIHVDLQSYPAARCAKGGDFGVKRHAGSTARSAVGVNDVDRKDMDGVLRAVASETT